LELRQKEDRAEEIVVPLQGDVSGVRIVRRRDGGGRVLTRR
jgi:hypothetical protein